VARKIVLADASPLIGLARVGGLPWLRKLYRSISITKAVRAEATAARGLPGAVAISAALIARPAASKVDPAAVDLDETLAECHDERFAAAGS